MDADQFSNNLKKTLTPNKIRESLLDNDYLSDITFILGDNEDSLKAHKMFLVTASPIFHQLLTNEADLNVKIQQIQKPIMMEVCRFAYSENINLTADNMLDILFAASKFEMKFLIEKVVDYACKEMNEKTVFKIFEANEKYNNLRFNKRCFEVIEKMPQKCFKDPNFLKISQETLRNIISTCKIPQEIAKNALTAWSKCNSTDDLEELMALVSLNDVITQDSDNESIASSKASESRSRRPPRNRNDRNRSQNRPPPRQFSAFPAVVNPMMMPSFGYGNVMMSGRPTRRNFKYANLDLFIQNKTVIIDEVDFIYDLKAIDQQFEFSIFKTDHNQRICLYRDNVIMIGSMSYQSYTLSKKVEIPAGTKIWIRIEFPKQEFRLTFDDFNSSSNEHLVMRKEPSVNSYAQIISKISYFHS